MTQAQASTIFVDGFEEYCSLEFTDLPPGGWFNGSVCANGTHCNLANVTISVAQTGNCVGISSVQLFDGESLLATDSSPTVGGTSVFHVLIEDGTELQLEARAFEADTEIASSGIQSKIADFTPPVVDFISSDVEGFQTPWTGADLSYNAALDSNLSAPNAVPCKGVRVRHQR